MKDRLAYLFGKLFLFFWNACAMLDPDMALGTIKEMVATQNRILKMEKQQARYRRAVATANFIADIDKATGRKK